MTSLALCSTSDIFNFGQKWHHLYSTPAGGKDLSSDTQIRLIGSVEPEICTKMLRNLSDKLRPKFPATIRGYSIAKIARLGDAFLEFLEMKQAQ